MTLALAVAERKQRLPHGIQKKIAARAKVSRAYVSGVAGATFTPQTEKGRRTYRRIAALLAREINDPDLKLFPEVALPLPLKQSA